MISDAMAPQALEYVESRLDLMQKRVIAAARASYVAGELTPEIAMHKWLEIFAQDSLRSLLSVGAARRESEIRQNAKLIDSAAAG